MLTVEVVTENRDIFLTLTREEVATIINEPDLKKRDELVFALGKQPIHVIRSSDDVDLSVVIDSQPAENRWDDVQEDWLAASKTSPVNDENDDENDKQWPTDGDMQEQVECGKTASINDLKALGYNAREDTHGLISDCGGLVLFLRLGTWQAVGFR